VTASPLSVLGLALVETIALVLLGLLFPCLGFEPLEADEYLSLEIDEYSGLPELFRRRGPRT